MAGKKVIITRRGMPEAELRPATKAAAAPTLEERRAGLEWLASGRLKPNGPAPNSVELLNMIYDDLDS